VIFLHSPPPSTPGLDHLMTMLPRKVMPLPPCLPVPCCDAVTPLQACQLQHQQVKGYGGDLQHTQHTCVTIAWPRQPNSWTPLPEAERGS